MSQMIPGNTPGPVVMRQQPQRPPWYPGSWPWPRPGHAPIPGAFRNRMPMDAGGLGQPVPGLSPMGGIDAAQEENMGGPPMPHRPRPSWWPNQMPWPIPGSTSGGGRPWGGLIQRLLQHNPRAARQIGRAQEFWNGWGEDRQPPPPGPGGI